MHPAFQARLIREPHPSPPRSLLAAAVAVTVCLSGSVAVAATLILEARDLRATARRLANGASVDGVHLAAEVHHHHVACVVALSVAGASVVTVAAWTGMAHRNCRLRGSSWAVVLGWLIPVINLWSPPRMLGRIRSAQLRAAPRSARLRAHYELIALWWLLLLASVGLASFIAVDEPGQLTADSAVHEQRILALTVAGASAWIAGALVLLAVVAFMTAANEQQRRPAAPLAPVTHLAAGPGTVSGYPSSIFPVAVHPSDPRWKPEPPESPSGYWR